MVINGQFFILNIIDTTQYGVIFRCIAMSAGGINSSKHTVFSHEEFYYSFLC